MDGTVPADVAELGASAAALGYVGGAAAGQEIPFSVAGYHDITRNSELQRSFAALVLEKDLK